MRQRDGIMVSIQALKAAETFKELDANGTPRL